MNRESLQLVLKQAGIHETLSSINDLSGGCIHHVCALELEGGRKLVAKSTHLEQRGVFEEEMESLRALADTHTVMTPIPLGVYIAREQAFLLMTHLKRGSVNDVSWRSLAENLAALHHTDVGTRYGYPTDNHIGATLQPNGWCEDWISFNAEHRLDFQLRLASDTRSLTGEESQHIRKVIDRLDRLIPRSPHPSLLHGDLWSGNALATVDARGDPRIAIIDPAASIGDGWADIAMMKLFGGFSSSCFEAYAALNDDQDQLPERIAVYQLYHVLNHVNLFGRGYVGQALALADGLL